MAEDIRVVAFIHAEHGHQEAVRDACLACVAPTRAEPGNATYVLHRDAQDASLFVFVEHWHSRSALDGHMQSPHFQALTRALDGKLAQPMIVHVLQPV